MSLRHIGILLGKEIWQGPKSSMFFWVLGMPVLISLVVSLAFGTLFSEKPELGILDEGDSQLVALAGELTSVNTSEYDSVEEIKEAVEQGVVDMGIVLPDGFDAAVIQGEVVGIEAYIWGESLAQNRIIMGSAVANLVRELSGQESPVEIEAITLGDEVSIPWSDRLLPLVVLMAVFLGGVFLPATSVIDEKDKKTLEALVITPVSIGEFFIAKGIFGFALSLIMGVVILLINQVFGAEPVLLVLVLALGAIMAAELGLLCGALLKDVTSLFAVWKTAGIFLFGPALIYAIPQIPQWIGRIFPTYYLLQPIVEISQTGASWADVALNVSILAGLDLLLASVIVLVLKRTRQFAG